MAGGRILTLICVLIFSVGECMEEYAIRVSEQSELKRLSTWNFEIILREMDSNMPNIDQTDSWISTQFLDVKVPEYHIVAPLAPVFLPAEKQLLFQYPGKVFGLRMTFYWIRTFGILPLSGTAVVSITASNVTYVLQFQRDGVSPNLRSLHWEIGSVTFPRNPIATLLKLDIAIHDVLVRQFNAVFTPYIQTKLMQTMREYYKIKYPQQHTLMISYFESTHTIVIPTTFADFSVTNNSLSYTYKQTSSNSLDSTPVPSHVKVDEGSAIVYEFSNEALAGLLSQVFPKLYPLLLLRSEDIPANSSFELNSEQFAQVLPDFYLEFGRVPLNATVNALQHNLILAPAADHTLKISGFRFNLTFATYGYKLMSAAISISGHFQPHVSIISGEDSALLQLDIMSLHTEVEATESARYSTIIQSGLKAYLNLGLESWIRPIIKHSALGHGLFLAFNRELDPSKACAEVTHDGVKAVLFSLP